MGASRYLVGFVCVALLAGCTTGSDGGLGSEDFDLDYDTADGPNLPVPPPDSTCVLIQRGLLGNVEDTDIGYGNGANWAAGAYPFTWTGPSPYDHWSVYQFDLSPVPPGKDIVLAVFSTHASWTQYSSTVRAHQVTAPWSEATATWANFGGTASWDASVLGTFDPFPGGFRSVDITGLTEQWYTGQTANHGILLEEPGIHPHEYYGSEVGTQVRRPSLYVCWTDAAPPVCGNAGTECTDNADCCDGMTCNGGVCGTIICGSSGASCASDANCCEGFVCDGGTCAVPGDVCAPPGGECEPGLPCCDGALCSEGMCPGGGGGDEGGGGGGCFSDVGGACGSDLDCCNGSSCWDGVCVDMNACIGLDSAEACDPAHPCCGGGHCAFGLCFAEESFVCVEPGAACDEIESACCWADHTCINGTCQAAP